MIYDFCAPFSFCPHFTLFLPSDFWLHFFPYLILVLFALSALHCNTAVNLSFSYFLNLAYYTLLSFLHRTPLLVVYQYHHPPSLSPLFHVSVDGDTFFLSASLGELQLASHTQHVIFPTLWASCGSRGHRGLGTMIMMMELGNRLAMSISIRSVLHVFSYSLLIPGGACFSEAFGRQNVALDRGVRFWEMSELFHGSMATRP